MNSQLNLFRWNTSSISIDQGLIAFEKKWIDKSIFEVSNNIQTPTSFSELKKQLTALSSPIKSESSDLIAEKMPLEQFRLFAQEYAPDGLTEANAMFAAVPRIHGAAKFPVMRILSDEFGKGQESRSHAVLYRNLLAELKLPAEVQKYSEQVSEESYAFVNVYHWMTKRADKIDYYLGALAFSESVVPWSFKCLVDACERLGIKKKEYFTEHVHVDPYHTKEAFSALEILAGEGKLDLRAALIGAHLAKLISEQAFENAVKKCAKGAVA